MAYTYISSVDICINSRNYCQGHSKELGKQENSRTEREGEPKTIPDQHTQFIVEAMAENDELTASDLLKKLKKKLRSPVF